MYPLGSCTMKHNPRLNEKMARLPGFADIHPLQPQATVQGALALMAELGRWLEVLTGMPAVALSPKAGAHGELCGLMAIRAAHEARGDARRRVLVPDSAHGTNPATAAMCGYVVDPVPSDADGRVDRAARIATMPQNSPCAPAAGYSATAGMPVRVFSQWASWSISSRAPCTVDCGCSGWMSEKPGRRAIFSLRRGLCFIVHEPSG
jgi:glycine cleavage system protein P-like pyridoxal-binding family